MLECEFQGITNLYIYLVLIIFSHIFSLFKNGFHQPQNELEPILDVFLSGHVNVQTLDFC